MYMYLDEEVITEYCKSKDCERLPCEMNGFMQYLEVQNMIDKKGDILGRKSKRLIGVSSPYKETCVIGLSFLL